MTLRSVLLTALLTLTALGGRSYANTTVYDWAYRCADEDTVLYIAIRADSFLQLEFNIDSANILLAPTGESLQMISLDDAAGFGIYPTRRRCTVTRRIWSLSV